MCIQLRLCPDSSSELNIVLPQNLNSPPENNSFRKDFCFTADVFIFFCQRKISEMRGLTGVKFWTMFNIRHYFIMLVQNFEGGRTPKFSGVKNMQNLARFRTTSKFGGEYLQNGWRYSKSDSHSMYGDSSCVKRNKYGEVWSSDLGDLDVKSYPTKAQFSEDHISAPRGCCTPKFLHALENDQVLLAHPPLGTGAPLTTFFKGESKIGLKCNKLTLITSVLRGVARRNFGTWCGSRLGC